MGTSYADLPPQRLVLSPDQHKQLLLAAGIKIKHLTGSSARCSCPFHKDKNPSFSVNLKAGIYFCHSCKKKGTLPQLVYELTGKGARHYVGGPGGEIYHGKGDFAFGGEDMGALLSIASLYHEEKSPEEWLRQYQALGPPSISGALVGWRKSRDVTDWVKRRDIPEQTADDWDFQYAHHVEIVSPLEPEEDEDVSSTIAHKRVIIPLHGPEGNLLSVEARAIHPYDKIKTLYVKPIDFLFRYQKLDTSKPVYVCEGLVDAARLYPVESNVTYLFGSNLSLVKEHLLRKFPEVVMIPDNDAPGYQLVKTFMERGVGTKVLRLPEHVEDLGDIKMTNSYIRRWFGVTKPENIPISSLERIINEYESTKRRQEAGDFTDVPYR